jgi:hypothetical protein
MSTQRKLAIVAFPVYALGLAIWAGLNNHQLLVELGTLALVGATFTLALLFILAVMGLIE